MGRGKLLVGLLLLAALSACGSQPATRRAHGISGAVRGVATSGIIIDLAGTASATVSTDATGTYAFAGLPDGMYTVRPSLDGYGADMGRRWRCYDCRAL